MTWRYVYFGLTVGLACSLLQPAEPQSAIATLLIGTSVLVLVRGER